MYFEVIGTIQRIETVAVGDRIRDIAASDGARRRSSDSWTRTMAKALSRAKFVLCIADEDCDDLEKRKVYPLLPDGKAKRDGYVRVIDESDEDYLYPESLFVRVDIPSKARAALSAAS